MYVRRKPNTNGVYIKRKYGCCYYGYVLQTKTRQEEKVGTMIEIFIETAKN